MATYYFNNNPKSTKFISSPTLLKQYTTNKPKSNLNVFFFVSIYEGSLYVYMS